MSTIDDGGPAFAAGAFEHNSSGTLAWQDGMSLRDYFATHCVGLDADRSIGLATQLAATQGMKKPSDNKDVIGWHRFWCAVHAAHRYMMADAMLAARKPNPNQ